MTWKQTALRAAHRVGALRLTGSVLGRSLTVLAYHRVIEYAHPGFGSLRRNVSATPGEFASQMEYAARRLDPISLDRLADFARGEADLPRRALLVTFDDGYRDNLEQALPIMERFGINPTVFLATDHIGTDRPFTWDAAAWCFEYTRLVRADLPVVGHRSWATLGEREAVLGAWVEALKGLPDADKDEAVARLPEVLEVEMPAGAFAGLYLSWDEVRSMAAAGVSFGGHTRRHPILTRVSPEGARAEIEGCRDHLAAELDGPPIAFAYPNGGHGDFDAGTVALLAGAGFELGFTLIPGPARHREVAAAPLAIRRVYLHQGAYPARFAAKAHGVPRLLKVAQ